MITNMKQAFGLMKYTASKRTVLPFLIIYPLLCLMDLVLYKSLFIVPLIVAILPVIFIQFIYAAEMANFVITAGNRKKTILNGTIGVVGVTSLLCYGIDVLMLYIEYRVKGATVTNDELVYPPAVALMFASIMIFVMLTLSPFIYRKYILTMIIFIPCCGLLGGVVGFLSATITEEYGFDAASTSLAAMFPFGAFAILGLCIILLGLALFTLNSYLMYKFPMDRFAFRQMFREKKGIF